MPDDAELHGLPLLKPSRPPADNGNSRNPHQLWRTVRSYLATPEKLTY
ncbi:hypothetical protein JNG74_15360 [Proteus mirabilis]|nr:hypothetical protein [Proteus mirabilis]MCI9754215.1 hypothetical protein [Proteus mirabilis]MCI9764892.1 hypothetical protein [Proteus mirabilis]MCI9783072.1 hypothetical protein [Proteus mirabilis]